MSSQDPESRSQSPRPVRWQFGLRTMFVVTALVAFCCATLFTLPNTVAVLLLALAVVLPALLTTFLVYGGGYLRTFCIGALFPAGVALYPSAWFLAYLLMATADRNMYWEQLAGAEFAHLCRWIAGTSWVFAIVVGLMCVGARWAVSGKKRPP